jgi:U3 small nucleolar RNA-associated protein 6
MWVQEEISAIARKRSDFEHIVNARGSEVSDYVRYAAYEQNLESLKKKRLQRFGIKNFTHGGQRRTFFIFERATRKFPGDIQLWMQYLDYTRSVKAHKRLGKVFTAVLRLHPTKAELWVVAARYAIQTEGELGAARSYLQRGLRFCPRDKPLWIEYCRLEMRYIEKTAEHLFVLGASRPAEAMNSATSESSEQNAAGLALVEEAQNIGSTITAANPDDKMALDSMATTPVLSGAIPMAIFDSAMKEFDGDAVLAEQFFDTVAEFHHLTCCGTILKHIFQLLQRQVPATSNWALCSYKMPLVGIEPTSSKFPMALRHALQMLRAAMGQQRRAKTKYQTAQKAAIALLPLVTDDTVDHEVKKVVHTVLKQMYKVMGGDMTADVVGNLQAQDKLAEATYLLKLGLKQDAANKQLQARFEQQTALQQT